METLLVVFAILGAGALTPGPNNLMVMAAGARGGFAAAGPLIGGVVTGGLVLLALAWLGVAAVLETAPGLRWALAGLGAGYLVFLGSDMIRADHAIGGARTSSQRNVHWLGVAAFQLFNPKAWVLLVTAATAMARTFEGLQGLGVLAAIYCLRSAVSLTVWALAGSAIARRFGELGPALDRSLGALLIVLALLFLAGQV